MPFWQAFKFKARAQIGRVHPVPGKPPPSPELLALLTANPGVCSTVMAHSTPFETVEAAARDLLTFPYEDADAYVVEAESSQEVLDMLRLGKTERATCIGRTRGR